ncbi:TetR/AcrR family transcriptional regulator [Nocardia brasiliensis]|uniref:TetR/AcrR family transcriptional regulator n=1 Tax=Nocardia brasiliensis TaxID=37326 RepID=UPI00189510B9|nr:TetR/AcrR family transcriptional regulator [Nocardia brasiliensis]MBF6126472.1 TetR/AcrR family transcriptional regulator [Nocardia brasiliensis]
MVSGPDLVRPARGTRPANRRALIVAAAADLFCRNGYADVGMGDVAAAVAMGPSALYRHFRGKQSLLATVVGEALTAFAEAVDAAAAQPDEIGATLAATMLARRDVGVLWRREARHLSVDDRAEFRATARRIGARLAGLIAARRPDLTPAAADLLAWSALAVANSVSFHSLSLPEPEFGTLLGELVDSVVHAPPPVFGELRDLERDATPLAALDRREAILTEATKLFAARGFASVRMDEIGAAVGIAGPSVYNHFPGKADILLAAIVRGDEWLRRDLHRALAQAAGPRDALERLLASYSAFVFENPHLMQTLVSEARQLPEADRRRAKAAQRAYIAEWVHLLRRLRPEWEPIPARIRVQAAQSMLNDLASTRQVRAYRDVDTVAATIAAEVLGLPGPGR